MPNTKSAKKAVRSSLKKRDHNQLWKNRIKSALKAVKKTVSDKVNDPKLIAEQLNVLQKTVDKATKEKVIHINKANRLKSNYARKTAKFVEKSSSKSKSTKKA